MIINLGRRLVKLAARGTQHCETRVEETPTPNLYRIIYLESGSDPISQIFPTRIKPTTGHTASGYAAIGTNR